ncbi:MAG: hypothetical protein ACF8PN_08365 [Phycisphaerales bacterium]
MWDRVREHVEIELDGLNRLIDDHRSLLKTLEQRDPVPWERSAIAAMLHSFYCGVENCFARIAREIDGARVAGPDSHATLLMSMTKPARHRSAVIPVELAGRLKAYLRFRHFFRHAYTFNLDWLKMAPLVEELEEVARDFERAIRHSLNRECAED